MGAYRVMLKNNDTHKKGIADIYRKAPVACCTFATFCCTFAALFLNLTEKSNLENMSY